MSTFYDGLYALQYPPCPGGTIYIIRQGDTLFAIAQRFGTTVNALIAANPRNQPPEPHRWPGNMYTGPGSSTCSMPRIHLHNPARRYLLPDRTEIRHEC